MLSQYVGLLNCTQQEFLSNAGFKLQSAKQMIFPWHSWYENPTFLKAFANEFGIRSDCYETNFDFFIGKKNESIRNNATTDQIAKELDALKKDKDFF